MSNITEECLHNLFYVPVATSNTKGIASFFNTHFDVVNGQVRIKQEYFKNLYDDYTYASFRKLKMSSSYDQETGTLNQTLHLSDGTLITGSGVTLPLADYADNLDLTMISTKLYATLKHGNTTLVTRSCDITSFSNKIQATKEDIGNVIVRLYNNNTMLSETSIDMSSYGTRLTATVVDDVLTLKLLHGNKQLSSQNVTLPSITSGDSGDDVTPVVNYKISLSMTDDFVITAKLLDEQDNVLSSSFVDLPLESTVVGADEKDGTITLTLTNGTTTSFYIGDLVSGLVSQSVYDSHITAYNTFVNTTNGKFNNIYTKTQTDTAITTKINEAITQVLNTEV